MISYTARFEPDTNKQDGRFNVTFLDLPAVITQGDDEQHAREMALDALIFPLKHQIATGSPIPRPHNHRGLALRSIPLPALAAAKLELHWVWQASGLSKSALHADLIPPSTTRWNLRRPLMPDLIPLPSPTPHRPNHQRKAQPRPPRLRRAESHPYQLPPPKPTIPKPPSSPRLRPTPPRPHSPSRHSPPHPRHQTPAHL